MSCVCTYISTNFSFHSIGSPDFTTERILCVNACVSHSSATRFGLAPKIFLFIKILHSIPQCLKTLPISLVKIGSLSPTKYLVILFASR
jgi:hypothetical protein